MAVIPLVSWNPSFGSSFSSSRVLTVTWEFSQSLDLAPNQIVCCSLFAMSFANLVHLCYIFSPDYSNWQRPSVQTQTGSRVQGKKLELIQAHFIDHDFLLKHLVWDGHVTRGSALTCFLLYVLQRLPDPQTIFEVPLRMCLESPANKGNASFN